MLLTLVVHTSNHSFRNKNTQIRFLGPVTLYVFGMNRIQFTENKENIYCTPLGKFLKLTGNCILLETTLYIIIIILACLFCLFLTWNTKRKTFILYSCILL